MWLIPKNRLQELDQDTTDKEKSQLRAALGACGWHTGQLGYLHSAEVGWQLSNIKYSTVRDMVKVNKKIKHIKETSKNKMMKRTLAKQVSMCFRPLDTLKLRVVSILCCVEYPSCVLSIF